MTKQLRTISLFFILYNLCVMNVQSQHIVDHSIKHSFLSSPAKSILSLIELEKKVFSYDIGFQEHDHDHKDEFHMHDHKLTLLDIISSEENSDFNCSGGFCMNRSHLHKKGLTLKKQLFEYFMSISC